MGGQQTPALPRRLPARALSAIVAFRLIYLMLRRGSLTGVHHAGGLDLPRLNGQGGTHAANEGITLPAIRALWGSISRPGPVTCGDRCSPAAGHDREVSYACSI
jgi:hypothetical protein